MFYCVGVSPRQAHKNYNFPAVSFRPTKRVFVILNEVKNLDLHAIRSFAGAQDDKLRSCRAEWRSPALAAKQ